VRRRASGKPAAVKRPAAPKPKDAQVGPAPEAVAVTS
jgi:hypothetical protein